MTCAYFSGSVRTRPSLQRCPSPLRSDASNADAARQAGAAVHRVVLGRLARRTTDSDVLSSLVVPQRNPLPRAHRDLSRPHSVGPRPGGSFLSWPTSPLMQGATRMPQRSRRSPWRRSGASMRCSIVSAAATAKAAEERPRARKEQSAPLLTALEAWPREQRTRLSNSSSVAKPIDYMLRRWDRFAHFIEDGRICLTASISFLISLDLALSMASHPVRKKTIRKSGSIPRIAGKHRDC